MVKGWKTKFNLCNKPLNVQDKQVTVPIIKLEVGRRAAVVTVMSRSFVGISYL